MAAAAYVIELVFSLLGLVPDERTAKVVESSVSWNYTTWLNIVFLVLALALVWRFVRTGGVPMLRMMGGTPDSHRSTSADVNSEVHPLFLVAVDRAPELVRPLLQRDGELGGLTALESSGASSWHKSGPTVSV
jgi:hypothetical protein